MGVRAGWLLGASARSGTGRGLTGWMDELALAERCVDRGPHHRWPPAAAAAAAAAAADGGLGLQTGAEVQHSCRLQAANGRPLTNDSLPGRLHLLAGEGAGAGAGLGDDGTGEARAPA